MDRAAWIEALFSTEPADRPRAAAAARAFYRTLGLEAPQHIVWFENPSAGAWAVALLLGPTSLWAGIVAQVEREPEQRPAIDRARERVGQINAGPSLTGRLTSKRLFTDRLSLYPDLQAFQRASIFTDDDDLSRAENQFRGTRRGVAGYQESAGRAGGLIHASQLSIYPMSQMAADEAQAAGGPVPPLLEALWDVARSSGPWWAFEHAVLLTDRPCEVHLDDRFQPHSPDGPAMVYRDGWRIYAWEGQPVESPGPPEPPLVLGPQGFTRVPVLGTPRPESTSKSRKSLLERYCDGEYKEVWNELIALGPAVRQSPYAKPARLVAQETMRRVAANVDTVIRRLGSMGYRFRMQKGAHIPPGPHTDRLLNQLDELAGPAPLSIATFYEIVGSIDLTGYHEHLTASSLGYFLPDPLVVLPLDQMLEHGAAADGNFGRIYIAPDAYHKAEFSDGAPYEMALPDARADGELLNERHGLFFVDYLRLAFRWGGFPGYDGVAHLTGVIALLRAELLAF